MNWYGGFRRVVILLWVGGAVTIIVLSVHLASLLNVGSMLAPFENVCTASDAKDHDECLRSDVLSRVEALTEAGCERYSYLHGCGLTQDGYNRGLTREQYRDEVRQQGVDPSRIVRRWTIPAYRWQVGIVLIGLLMWTGAVWGIFYLSVWIARGFAQGGGAI